MIAPFWAMMPSMIDDTRPNFDVMSARLISKPTLKKNNSTSTPVTAIVPPQSSPCALTLDVASIIADAKDPRVLMSPYPSVRKDIPRTVARMRPTNYSWFEALTTQSNSGPKTCRPHTSRAEIAMRNAKPMDANAFPMPATHEPFPPDHQDLLPQEQASLR